MTHSDLATYLFPVALGIDLVGIFIILWGFVYTLYKLIKQEISRVIKPCTPFDLQKIRVTLGMYILLALEFMIASDIIHSVVSRSLDDLKFLVVIVIVRTTIGFFLGKDLSHIKEQGGFHD